MKPSLLRAQRRQQGWSQAKLAEALGVSTRTVRRWERGGTIPYPYYRRQLSALFGKTIQQLGLPEEIDEESTITEGRADITSKSQSSVLTRASVLTDPAIPQIPSSVQSLQGHAWLFMQVKRRIFKADNLTLTVLSGLPGIGKTTLAAILATDPDVQARFHDGILWAALGRRPHVLNQLARWGMLLGIDPSDLKNPQSSETWRQALRSAIGRRQMLLVIDDAWTPQDILALQVGGPLCTHLVTTCTSQVTQAFTRQESILVPQLKKADGLVLLAHFVPELVQQDPQSALALAHATDGLPLALTLIGKYLATLPLTRRCQHLQNVLTQFYDIHERLCLSMLHTSRRRSASLAESVPLSLYTAIAICGQDLSLSARAALYALTVFPPNPHSFSEQAALTMVRQPREALHELCTTGLLESWEPKRYSLHQAIADYTRARAKSHWYNGDWATFWSVMVTIQSPLDLSR